MQVKLKVVILACSFAFHCSNSLPLLGQSPAADSLMMIWNDEARPDIDRIKAVHDIIWKVYMGRELDSALLFANRQLAFAIHAKNKNWQSKALANKAAVLAKSGDYKTTKQTHLQNLEIQKELRDTKNMADSYKGIGYILRKQGHYSEALENYQKSLELAEKLGEAGKVRTAATLNSMGSLYIDQKDYDKALKHYEQSLILHLKLQKKSGIASNYNNMAQVFYYTKQYDKALDYLYRSLEIKKEIGNTEGVANVYLSLGNIRYDLGEFTEAKKHYEKSYFLRDSVGLKDDLAESCNCLGKVSLAFQEYEDALRWCTQGRNISKSVGNVWEEAQNCECQYLAHKKMGNDGLALGYLEEYQVLQDSMFNREATEQLAKLETQFQYEKEKTAAAILQAQERAIMETKLQQQSLLRNIFIFAALVFALFAYLTLRVNRARRLQNRELKLKNEQIEKDRRLIQSQAKELKALDELKNRFFTNISHELRTPITLITAPIEQLLNGPAKSWSSNVQNNLRMSLNNGRKLRSLVEELLDLSRLEANKIQLHETPTALAIFCRRLFDAFRPKATEKQIDYQFQSALDEQTLFWIDRKRLEKIINNLLSNAFKFTPSQGKISFCLDCKDQNLRIQVEDDGRGVPPEDLPHIFERYYQTKRKDIAAEGGTGVGLALSSELARLMKGELSVESEWGEGSNFKLQFPVRSAEGETMIDFTEAETNPSRDAENRGRLQTAIAPAPAADVQKQASVLIVEDNPDMRQLLHSLLNEHYGCSLAANGAQAWNSLRERGLQADDIDLIISDVMMPEMDGYTFLNHLKADPVWQNTPVIMLTAKSSEEDKLKALRLGVDDYLTKPFSPEELQIRTRKLIDNARKRKAFLQKDQRKVDIEFAPLPGADQSWLKKLEDAAKHALNHKLDLSASYLSQEMTLSERQLRRRLKALTGLPIKQYVLEIKLQKARQLLENKSFHTISEVAYASGFNTPAYFSRVFEKHYGKRPGEYGA